MPLATLPVVDDMYSGFKSKHANAVSLTAWSILFYSIIKTTFELTNIFLILRIEFNQLISF